MSESITNLTLVHQNMFLNKSEVRNKHRRCLNLHSSYARPELKVCFDFWSHFSTQIGFPARVFHTSEPPKTSCCEQKCNDLAHKRILHCLSVVFLFVSDPWSLYQPVKSPEYASFKDKKQNQTGLIQVLLRGFVDSWAFIITSITCLYISLLVTIVI